MDAVELRNDEVKSVTVRPARPVAGFIVVIAIAMLVYVWSFLPKPEVTIISDYATWLAKSAEGSFVHKIAWLWETGEMHNTREQH